MFNIEHDWHFLFYAIFPGIPGFYWVTIGRLGRQEPSFPLLKGLKKPIFLTWEKPRSPTVTFSRRAPDRAELH
jgi:hypothetical protein